MDKTTLTPKKVKVIESALEERKTRADRRKSKEKIESGEYAGPERRTGRDRRDD